jgi:multiple sugar transport system substrate-binding protein
MFKRLLFVLLVLGLFGGLAAGQVSLRVVCSPDNADALKWIASEFMKQHPDIRVTVESISWETLYPLELADFAGQVGGFDIFTWDVMTAGAVAQGCLDLAEFRKQHPELVDPNWNPEAFIPMVRYISGYWAGKEIGAPFYNNTMLLYYRKDLFEDPAIQAQFKSMFGRELTVPTSWAEAVDVAKFFTKKYNPKSPTEYGIALMFPRTHTLFYMYLLFFGPYRRSMLAKFGPVDLDWGDYFTADHKPAFDSIEGLRALQDMQALMPYAPDPLGSDYGETIEYFARGLVAMCPQWTGPYLEFKQSLGEDKVGVALMPGRSVSGNWALAINKFISPEKQKAAFLFIQFATSAYADKGKFIRFAVAPTRQSTLSDPEALAVDPRVPVLQETYATETNRPRIPEEPKLEDLAVGYFSEILLGTKPLTLETLHELALKWLEVLGAK